MLLANAELLDKPLEAEVVDGGGRPTPSEDGGSLECEPGRGDCDGDPSNGCEVDLRSDELHCGICGDACPSGAKCKDAVCDDD
jgi:hypothetical protein